MTDAVQIFPPGFRVLDADGNPVSGGSLLFYDAGTSNAKTVYSDSGLTTALGATVYLDSGGHPVSASGGTNKVLVYTGTAAYKVTALDASAATVWTLDNIKGAVNTSTFLTDGDLQYDTPVIAVAANRAVTVADKGALLDCNCTGGAITITFNSAVTLTDGFRVGIRHNGTANTVNLTTVSSQTVGIPGADVAAFVLTQKGETVWISCDGTGFKVDSYVPAKIFPTSRLLVIADILSTPPGSPTAGALYLVSSAPTGAWSSYAQHDVVQADGQGTWIKITPTTDHGWLAYVQDEDEYYAFVGSAWQKLVLVRNVAASQSDQETATEAIKYVSPAIQQHHPSANKVWLDCRNSGTPTNNASYNVSSLTDVGTGNTTINVAVAFSAANYAVSGTVQSSSTVNTIDRWAQLRETRATGSFGILTGNVAAAQQDVSFSVTAQGDQ
jgi:hypothetical protein